MTPGRNPWTLIGASAGTGKTHQLTDLVWKRVKDPEDPLPPEGLVAVTFTKKAAAELGQRIRTKLYGEGAADEAQRLGMAYLGTVHSVGLRLVQEHAFETGASPDVRLLPEDGGRLLRGLLERAVPAATHEALDALAERFQVHVAHDRYDPDWHRDVFDLVAGARANRIGPDALADMARRSFEGLASLLDPVVDASRDLDAELLAAVAQFASEVEANGDTTKGTRDVLTVLAQAPVEVAHSNWGWWLKVAQQVPKKKSEEAYEEVSALAAEHLGHPRLRAELGQYLELVYGAAADMLRHYAEWKASLHVVDWTDMLEQALTTLDAPLVAKDLRERLRLVVVDELQDSTPLQLALFARLHALAGRSTWVGDRKQCVFEWGGADPALMDALIGEIKARGGDADTQLDTNRRSRRELVELTSELFATALGARGFDPATVRVRGHRDDPAELASVPAVGLAPYDAKLGSATALAGIVAGLLADPAATPVVDRVTDAARPLAPGDVAVLAFTNAECEALAGELSALGIRAAVARGGLLETPEGTAAMAALTLCVAPEDALAEAELEALMGFPSHAAPGAALEAARAAWLEARVAKVEARDYGLGPWSARLAPVRAELAALSPAAVLERCFEALDLPRVALGWPDAEQRLANLDALRALAETFEREVHGGGGALTLSGLVRALTAAREEPQRAQLDAAQHVSEGGDVVTIVTYHRSKGLEWPVVVLSSLGRAERRSAFEVYAESDAKTFSLDRPLDGRWLRYWPWPYGRMGSGELLRRVAASEHGRAVAKREHRERARLLYVGFTRPRDHLVLAYAVDAKGVAATRLLDELQTAAGAPAWSLGGPVGHELSVVRTDGTRLAVRTRRIGVRPSTQARPPVVAPVRVAPRAGSEPPRPPRALAPSRVDTDGLAALGGASLAVQASVALGAPLPLARSIEAWDRLGVAVHGFLASDGPDRPTAEREALAAAWLAAEEHAGTVAPSDVVAAADRLRAFVASRWPDATWHHEVPIAADLPDGRRVSGVIDLLLATPAGWVVIDHKTFPVATALEAKAAELAPQLATYRVALARQAEPRPVLATWLHFPLAGAVLELRPAGVPSAVRDR